MAFALAPRVTTSEQDVLDAVTLQILKWWGLLSLRAVSAQLAARGYLNERDKPYAAKSVASRLS